MKEYLVSREKLKEMLEADEKEKGYYAKRRVKSYKRLLDSEEEIYDHGSLSRHYSNKLRERSEEIGLTEHVEISSCPTANYYLQFASEQSRYTIFIGLTSVAQFSADLYSAEKTLDIIVDKLDEIVRIAESGLRHIEADIHGVIDYKK